VPNVLFSNLVFEILNNGQLGSASAGGAGTGSVTADGVATGQGTAEAQAGPGENEYLNKSILEVGLFICLENCLCKRTCMSLQVDLQLGSESEQQ